MSETANECKFGRDAKICFGKADMWIERYIEVTHKTGKKKGQTEKKWVRVTGYYSKLSQLLTSYSNSEFMKSTANLEEYRAILSDIQDAIKKIPEYFVSRRYDTPVILKEKIKYVNRYIKVDNKGRVVKKETEMDRKKLKETAGLTVNKSKTKTKKSKSKKKEETAFELF